MDRSTDRLSRLHAQRQRSGGSGVSTQAPAGRPVASSVITRPRHAMRAASTCRLPGLGPQVLGRPALAYRRASLRSKRPLHITAAAAGDAALPPQPGGGGGGGGASGSSKATPESLGRARQVSSDIVLCAS